MKIIEIESLDNGAHRNQEGNFNNIPAGFAIIPDDMTLENFPFGDIETKEIDGVVVVTKWIPGFLVETKIIKEPNMQDDIDAMLVDHEYRLTLLELGEVAE